MKRDAFGIGEVEGGTTLICYVCGYPLDGKGWFSGFIGGMTLGEVNDLALRHISEKHPEPDLIVLHPG